MTIKKQIFLSVTGLVIVIVLLVGVSYSFTDYSQVPDNLIRSGNMVFDFDNKDLVIKGKNPISYTEMKQEEYGNENNNSLIINLKINGYNTLVNGMNFKITLALDSEKAGNNLLDDSILYAQISPKNLTPGYSVVDFGENDGLSFGTISEGAPLTGINKGNELSLLIGNVHTAAQDAYQTFEIRVWLDSRKVVVSDIVNRDSDNRAIDVADTKNGLVAANKEDIGKIVYRTNEINDKMSALKIKAVNY